MIPLSGIERLYQILCCLPVPLRKAALLPFALAQKARLRALRTPGFLIFFVTNRCNARCSHCFYRAQLNRDTGQMHVSEIERVASSLKAPNTLLLTGGEPFLREDLLPICRSFYRRGKTRKLRIATNGSLPERVEAVTAGIVKDRAAACTIQVSLDGTEAFHDRQRQTPGLFARAFETLRRLRALQKGSRALTIEPVLTITEATVHEIPALSALLHEHLGLTLSLILVRDPRRGVYGVPDELRMDQTPPAEGAGLAPLKVLEEALREGRKERKKGFFVDFEALQKRIEMDLVFNGTRPFCRCLAGKTDAVIYPDGGVALCEMTVAFASLRDFAWDFGKLWNSAAASEMRRRLSGCFCMHPCHLNSALRHTTETILRLSSDR